jgi:hypothetical protein
MMEHKALIDFFMLSILIRGFDVRKESFAS